MENSSFEDSNVTNEEESEEVDHGEILWRSWEKARGQQIKRFESKKELYHTIPATETNLEIKPAVTQKTESVMRHPPQLMWRLLLPLQLLRKKFGKILMILQLDYCHGFLTVRSLSPFLILMSTKWYM